ncbi:MAG: YhfC family glutamic-type intramembrane protease [Oscillospiraceae bacterium]
MIEDEEKRPAGLWKPMLLGAIAFVASQVLLRLPLIQYVLPRSAWYVLFTSQHYLLYCIFLGVTAGLFEETARYLMVRCFLKNNRRFSDAIAFGLGHGGIEAVILLASVLAAGAAVSPWAYVERILAMTMHVGMTVIVFAGFQKGSELAYLAAAIGVHALVDSLCGILPAFGAGILVMEAVLAAFALCLLIYIFWAKKNILWQLKGAFKNEKIS